MICNLRRVRIPFLHITQFLAIGAFAAICAVNATASIHPAALASLLAGKSEVEQPTVKHQTNYLYSLARNHIRAGDVEKGKALLQQVLAIDPQHAKAKAELQQLIDSGVSSAPSKMLAQNTANSNALSAEELINLAKSMMQDKDYAGAQSALESALKKADDEKQKSVIRAYLIEIGKERERVDQLHQQVLDYNLT
ncbi:hypothetical protein K8I31_06635, partial [bacterium]|nr:hypothetical protein [bacterium]